MSNEQSQRLELLASLDELDRLQDRTTDSELLKMIAERKKALRTTLQSTLNA